MCDLERWREKESEREEGGETKGVCIFSKRILYVYEREREKDV